MNEQPYAINDSLARIARAIESVAVSLEKLAKPPVVLPGPSGTYTP